MKTLLKTGVLLGGSVLVSVILGEAAARLALDDITTTSDNGSYFALRWKRANVRLNRLGYREREYGKKPPGRYRIAMIGDSYTFGQGIPESDRMSNLLQLTLTQRAPGIEVLNFGVPGNNTADEVRVLRQALADAKPDFVLLQWFVNDIENKGPSTDVGASAPSPPAPSWLARARTAMRHQSVLYFLGGEVWHLLLDSVGPTYVDEVVSSVGDPDGVDATAARQELDAFFRIAREHDVPVGVVMVPFLMQVDADAYPFAFLHQRVATQCAEAGVDAVDLLPTFAPLMSDRQRFRDLQYRLAPAGTERHFFDRARARR